MLNFVSMLNIFNNSDKVSMIEIFGTYLAE